MENITDRILLIAKNEGIRITSLERSIGASKGVLSRAIQNRTDIQSKWIVIIVEKYPHYSSKWLLTGEGSMLVSDQKKNKNLIPLYDEVSTIGGSDIVAEDQAVYKSNIKIDAGDWFHGATAAIRHYGDSMVEYQSGCILAIRELQDKTEIIPGRNYVIETNERRITKRVSEPDENHLNCHSTNGETYPNGEMVHGPIKIKKEDIRRISKVMGAINYEESTGIVSVL
ncbi:MAG: S24 family peptidase [Psychroserpens sp.]|uniref:S24 family peptidase n=1 Tax=Psychroserpens sp. TaxID=2020870 RepID=UPI003C85BBEF